MASIWGTTPRKLQLPQGWWHQIGDRTRRACGPGILAFSGFVPAVDGWQPHFEDRRGTRAFIAHGRADPIMDVDFARRAREQLEAGALEVEYHESDVGHQIDPAHLRAAGEWLGATLPPG